MTNRNAGQPMRYFYERKVSEYMTRQIVYCDARTTLREAEALFARHDFNSFPVMENGKLIGVFSKFDFMRAFAFTEEHPLPDYRTIMAGAVRDFMREEMFTKAPNMPLTRVLQKMVERRTRSLPVVSEGRLVGVISREDVMKALAESTPRS